MTWHRRPSTLNGWAAHAQRTRILQAHAYTCHVCGHDGATQVDHIVNVAAGGTDHPANMAPIHGTPYGTHPCPVCGKRCHFDKTQDEAKRGMARRSRVRPQTEQHPGLVGMGGTPPTR